jgi:hypothetical protein
MPAPRHTVALFLVLLIALVSCAGVAPMTRAPDAAAQPATPVPTATSAPTPTQLPSPTAVSREVEAQAGIQETVDGYIEAYNTPDRGLLERLLDPANAPFRRYVLTRFDNFHDSAQGSFTLLPLMVESVALRDQGFAIAHLVTETGAATDWVFRELDGRWLLSEPSVAQLGAPQKVQHGDVTFVTYPWADGVNQTVIELFERAQRQVGDTLGRTTTHALTVEINPIYGLTPFDNPLYVAYYTPGRGERGPDRIQLFTPFSYNFGYYDEADGWEPELGQILAHEYTHMVHKRAFGNAGYETSWMPEGLAEYVSRLPNRRDSRDRVRGGVIIPIIDEKTAVYKQDLMHMTILDRDRDVAYAYAHTLVSYVVDQHGGLDGFWRLAEAYDRSQNLDTALQEAHGISYDAFNMGWRAWLGEGS